MAWFECTGGQPEPAPTPVLESYIYNIGNVAFNTGYTYKSNTKIKTKMAVDTIWSSYNYGWKAIFGNEQPTWRTNAFLFTTGDENKLSLYSSGSWIQGDKIDAPESSTSANWNNVPCIFEAGGNSIVWYQEADPTTIRSLTTSTYITNGIAPMALFNDNTATSPDGWNPSSTSCRIIFYWFEIYEDTTLLHRFVPAYNNSQWCIYDEIDKVYKYDTINNGAALRGCLVQP